ncbi:MAG: M20/M25/M40 family metallo-hydrolase [Desulfuromonadales bacterium]
MNQELQEQVWAAIDGKRLRQTLIDMIDIYSPSGKEEDIQLYLQERLGTIGAQVKRQVIDPDEPERYNLYTALGQQEPQLILVGHVDTVPAWNLDDSWAEEEWGVVRGLGAADMKGGCAAMLEAWLALAQLPVAQQPNVGLLFVVGEEENGDGSSRFLEENQPSWVVIGEPTSLSPCLSHYGYLEVGLTTRGRRIHSSLPELGHNAVESMLRFLLLLDAEPLFDRDNNQIVYSIREMSSSRAGFVVPDQCEAFIDLHLAPGLNPGLVQETIQACVDKAEHTIPELNIALTFDFSAPGYRLEDHQKFADILGEVYTQLNLPLQFNPFRSHSDGNLFFQAGCRPLILGPGSLETAHTADEQTSLSQVEAAARIYAALCLAGPG